jgi:SSS family solute:Na+ symporter
LIGWAAGMILGTALSWGTTAWVAVQPLGYIPFVGKFDLGFNLAVYNGLLAVIVNIMVATIISAVWSRQGADETQAGDYEDARVAA